MDKCTELFYSNNYQIVGIETFNGGGTCKLSFYFQELLQAKILPMAHYSTLKTQMMKEYVEANIPVITNDPDMDQRIDILSILEYLILQIWKSLKKEEKNILN